MKKLLLLLILCAASAVGGCSLNQDSKERQRRMANISDLQMRMLVDDWDHIWLMERNSRLTQWHPMVGTE